MRDDSSLLVEKYNDIGTLILPDNIVYAQSFKLKVTSGDYTRGFVTRYFVQKVNELTVQEVSPENYGEIMNELYRKVSFKWKITGPRESVGKFGKIDIVGVEDFNKNSIKEASKTIKELINFVDDYLEYWRGK